MLRSKPVISVLLPLGMALGINTILLLSFNIGFAAPLLQSVTGTKVRLQPPESFQPAKQFSGFIEESKQATISVQEFPFSFSKMREVFERPEELQKRGITILEKETVQVAGKDAILLKVEQRLGSSDVLQWILMQGTDTESVFIKAGFLKENTAELSEPLKQSLLTSQWDPSTKPEKLNLGYSLTPQGDLKLALEQRETQLYSQQGKFPDENPRKPLFIVATSLNPVTVIDPARYAEELLSQLAKLQQIKQPQILKSAAIQIDGLSGYAITAKAVDPKLNVPLLVYQVLLFQDDRQETNYFRMLGIVGQEFSEDYLPIFKQMSESFKRLNPPG